jgi:hypothetical protein
MESMPTVKSFEHAALRKVDPAAEIGHVRACSLQGSDRCLRLWK